MYTRIFLGNRNNAEGQTVITLCYTFLTEKWRFLAEDLTKRHCLMRTDSGLKAVAIKDKKVYPYYSLYYTFESNSVVIGQFCIFQDIACFTAFKTIQNSDKRFFLKNFSSNLKPFWSTRYYLTQIYYIKKHLKMCRKKHAQDKQIATPKKLYESALSGLFVMAGSLVSTLWSQFPL